MRLIGLEPTRRKTPDPKSGASTNFATGALCGCKDTLIYSNWQIFPCFLILEMEALIFLNEILTVN